MIRPVITLRRKRVLVDIDIQRDYFVASSPDCIRNHRRVLANIRRTMAWARLKNIRQISTTRDFHTDHSEEVENLDMRRISYTLRSNRKSYSADGCTDLARDILRNFDQVILHKRTDNPFSEPRADRILSELRADEFIIIGGLTETSVKSTVLGLLARKKYVTILTDAIGYCDRHSAEVALRQMEAKGAKLVEAKSLLGTSCLKQVGVCGCDRCRGKMQKSFANTG